MAGHIPSTENIPSDRSRGEAVTTRDDEMNLSVESDMTVSDMLLVSRKDVNKKENFLADTLQEMAVERRTLEDNVNKIRSSNKELHEELLRYNKNYAFSQPIKIDKQESDRHDLPKKVDNSSNPTEMESTTPANSIQKQGSSRNHPSIPSLTSSHPLSSITSEPPTLTPLHTPTDSPRCPPPSLCYSYQLKTTHNKEALTIFKPASHCEMDSKDVLKVTSGAGCKVKIDNTTNTDVHYAWRRKHGKKSGMKSELVARRPGVIRPPKKGGLCSQYTNTQSCTKACGHKTKDEEINHLKYIVHFKNSQIERLESNNSEMKGLKRDNFRFQNQIATMKKRVTWSAHRAECLSKAVDLLEKEVYKALTTIDRLRFKLVDIGYSSEDCEALAKFALNSHQRVKQKLTRIFSSDVRQSQRNTKPSKISKPTPSSNHNDIQTSKPNSRSACPQPYINSQANQSTDRSRRTNQSATRKRSTNESSCLEITKEGEEANYGELSFIVEEPTRARTYPLPARTGSRRRDQTVCSVPGAARVSWSQGEVQETDQDVSEIPSRWEHYNQVMNKHC